MVEVVVHIHQYHLLYVADLRTRGLVSYTHNIICILHCVACDVQSKVGVFATSDLKWARYYDVRGDLLISAGHAVRRGAPVNGGGRGRHEGSFCPIGCCSRSTWDS